MKWAWQFLQGGCYYQSLVLDKTRGTRKMNGIRRPINITIMVLAVVLGLAMATLSYAAPADNAAPAEDADSGIYSRWAWLKDTYWIVPQSGIYSIYHTGPDQFDVARGQTVFHITDYYNGYWTGVVKVDVTALGLPSCQYVMGQVTPEGRVHMTMYHTDDGDVVNYPIGTMVYKDDQWTMVNEMTSLTQTSGTLSHWAYMVQTREGDATWDDLPFANESVEDFMATCPGGPPILHKPSPTPLLSPMALLTTGASLAKDNPSPVIAPKTLAAPKADVVDDSGVYKKWSWLKDTYWIVPQTGIYSIYHSGTDQFVVAKGQTVFHITDYFNGYWTGVVKVAVTRGQIPSCQYVMGQVTPEGRVHMTMYHTDSGEVVNYPIGTMVYKDDQWTMVNEMTSLTQSGGTLSHWAYMVQSKEGDASWNDLPFVHQSIADFMATCPAGPPIGHKPTGLSLSLTMPTTVAGDGAQDESIEDVSAKALTGSDTGTGTSDDDADAGVYKQWAWFKDSYWIVPQAGIYSIYHTGADKFAVSQGQTVFHITDYFNGYWTGVVKVDITDADIPSCQYVLGQVTPEGKVHMTMYRTDTGEVVNYPIGTMVQQSGQWTMVNEMTSVTQNGGTLSHWAYMVQSDENAPTWNDLPFVHETVPAFMATCPDGPMILHKPGLDEDDDNGGGGALGWPALILLLGFAAGGWLVRRRAQRA